MQETKKNLLLQGINIDAIFQQFINCKIESQGQNIYKIYPPLSASVYIYSLNFTRLKISRCLHFDFIEFTENHNIEYHSSILAYLAILSKLPSNLFDVALKKLNNLKIFDDIM